MPILVTGGTGLLGVNLVRRLVSDGCAVRVLVRNTSSRVGLDSGNIEFIEGDITDAASVRRAMTGCDEVYHLAGWVQISSWGMRIARRVNVDGTRNVCQAALDVGVRRMLHTSSIAAIGTGTIDTPGTEQTPWNVADHSCPYHITKHKAERVVADYVERGLDAVIVNPTWVVGPWDTKPSAGRVIIRVAARRLPFYPRCGGINYVDVRNVAGGQILAMTKGRTGQRYILGGQNLSYLSFLTMVAELAGVPTLRPGPPYALLYPFAAVGSVLGRLWPRLFRDANLSLLRSAFTEHYVSSDKACRELGYEALPVADAVWDAIDWFVAHKYMKPVPGPRAGRSESVVSQSLGHRDHRHNDEQQQVER